MASLTACAPYSFCR